VINFPQSIGDAFRGLPPRAEWGNRRDGYWTIVDVTACTNSVLAAELSPTTEPPVKQGIETKRLNASAMVQRSPRTTTEFEWLAVGDVEATHRYYVGLDSPRGSATLARQGPGTRRSPSLQRVFEFTIGASHVVDEKTIELQFRCTVSPEHPLPKELVERWSDDKARA
jgi:hypothetical protein